MNSKSKAETAMKYTIQHGLTLTEQMPKILETALLASRLIRIFSTPEYRQLAAEDEDMLDAGDTFLYKNANGINYGLSVGYSSESFECKISDEDTDTLLKVLVALLCAAEDGFISKYVVEFSAFNDDSIISASIIKEEPSAIMDSAEFRMFQALSLTRLTHSLSQALAGAALRKYIFATGLRKELATSQMLFNNYIAKIDIKIKPDALADDLEELKREIEQDEFNLRETISKAIVNRENFSSESERYMLDITHFK